MTQDFDFLNPIHFFTSEQPSKVNQNKAADNIDEIVDEDELKRQEGEDIYKQMFYPSDNTLLRILNYLGEKAIKGSTEKPKDLNVQYFYQDSLYYTFSNNTDLNAIHKIACEMQNVNIFLHYLKGKPMLFNILAQTVSNESLFENVEKDYFILSELEDKILGSILNQFLSQVFTAEDKQKKKALGQINKAIPFNTTAQSLGKLMIQITIEHYLSAFINNIRLKKEKEIALKGLYDLSSTSYEECLRDLNIPESILSSLKRETKEALCYYLRLYLVQTTFVVAKNVDKPVFKQLKPDAYYTYALELGSHILNVLLNAKILEAAPACKNKTPQISIKQEQYAKCVASATFFKPTLSVETPKHSWTLSNFGINLDMTLDTELITCKYDTDISLDPQYRADFEEHCNIKYTLNREAVEQFFANLRHVITTRAVNRDYIPYDFLLPIFEMDFEEILENATTPEDREIVRQLIDFALSLTSTTLTEDLKELQTKLEANKDKNGYFTLFNRILSKKYFLFGLVNELKLYLSFNFFYIPKFLSSTGRIFSSTFFLSLQGPKICRAFIRFASSYDLVDENQYLLFREIITSHLPALDFKFPATLKDYKELRSEHYDAYLCSFLKKKHLDFKTLSEKDYLSRISDLGKAVSKPKDILFVSSLVSGSGLNTRDIFIMDATTSGPQMISLACQYPNLAKLSNVTGTTYQDFYQIFQNTFTNDCTTLKKTLDTLSNACFGKDIDIWFKDSPSYLHPELTELTLILKRILTDKSSDIRKDLVTFASKYSSENKQKLSSISNLTLPVTLHWLLVLGSSSAFFVNPISTTFQSKLFLLANILKFYLIYRQIPLEALKSRQLFKKQVMSFFYNAKSVSRREAFAEYFADYFTAHGLNKLPNYFFYSFNWSLNRFFELTMKSLAPEATTFLDLSRNFVNTCLINNPTHSIVIKLKYLNWSFFICKPDKCRIRIPVTYKKDKRNAAYNHKQFHRLSILKNTKDPDRIKMVITFASIYAHGLDAWIIHDLITELTPLNSALRAAGLPPIDFSSNHDSVGICVLYAPLLKPLLRICYNNLSSHGYGSLLGLPTDSLKPPMKVTNTNFFRF